MKLLNEAANFGASLIKTEDLDPVYSAIAGARLDEPLLSRLLVAYWCLYHLGSACVIAERGTTPARFWRLLERAALNDEPEERRWPRGTERRHWRGQQAALSALWLQERVRDPVAWVRHLASGGTFDSVAERVRAARGFGPWIAFKVADMLERVSGHKIDFAGSQLAFYDEPAKGATLILTGKFGAPAHPTEIIEVARALGTKLELRGVKHAPPSKAKRKRPLNMQEYETVLCKFKSHMTGHYPIGKDIKEVAHALAWSGQGRSELADELCKYVPRALS